MKYSTWEQAVQWLRQESAKEQLVRDCYYDDPLQTAAERFAHSEEWQAVEELLPPTTGRALDLGAGRGIGSYALAKIGWQAVAIEPDPSPLVGTKAIRLLAVDSSLPIAVVENYGEAISFQDSTFDLVYARQVLHHAHDLRLLCREVARVLKPGGRFVASREHVISEPQDLKAFLDNHPLHWLHGGENAYLLDQYVSAIFQSGLNIAKILGPFDTVINYFPKTRAQLQAVYRRRLSRFVGQRVAALLTNEQHSIGRCILARLSTFYSRRATGSGRMYSFVADKPC